MTIDRETVIRLAREANADEYTGWRDNGDSDRYYEFWPEQLERFAALVLEYGRKPLTAEQVKAVVSKAGYTESMLYEQSDFISGIRYSEAAHGIINEESSDAD